MKLPNQLALFDRLDAIQSNRFAIAMHKRNPIAWINTKLSNNNIKKKKVILTKLSVSEWLQNRWSALPKTMLTPNPLHQETQRQRKMVLEPLSKRHVWSYPKSLFPITFLVH